MPIPGLHTIEVEEYLGQLDALNLRDVPKEYSPDCPNCAFEPSSVFTRPATILKLDWGADVTNVLRMSVMLHSSGRYHLGLVVTGSGTEFAYFFEGDGSRTTLINAATLDQDSTHFRYAIYGNLVFIAFSNGNAGQIVWVWNPSTDTVDAPTVAAPTTSGVTAVTSGAGKVTAGLHKIIIIAVTRVGYESVPGATVIEYTAAADDSIDLASIPATTSTITSYIVGMTPADDNRYFQVGTTTATTFLIDISDEQLINQRSLDGHFLHMHPFKAYLNVFEYNNRLIWVAPSDEASLIWISQAGLPVAIRSDTGYIPIGREDGDRCTAAFQIRRGLYITKTRSIWVTQDTGGEPSTWVKPYPVCKWAGTLSPDGVTQTSDKDEALILDIKGPLRFLGGDPVAVGGNVTGTWDRLSYAYMSKSRIAIDPLEQRVFCWVPLDGATAPATLVVGDYKEGWNRTKWSPWTTGGTAWRDIAVDSAEVLIQEGGRYLTRFGDHANSGLPADPPENDRDGTAIASYYVTGLIEPRKAGIQNIAGVDIYGKGSASANLDLEMRNQNGTALTPALSPIVLSETPTGDFFRGMNYSQERWFFKFGTNAAGERFLVNRLTFSCWPEGQRPR